MLNHLLAVSPTAVFAQSSADSFWNLPIAAPLRVLLASIGIVVVIAGITKSVGQIAQGKIGAGVKIVVGTVFVAAFLIRPELIGSVLELFASFIESIIGSGETIIDGPSAPPPPPTNTP